MKIKLFLTVVLLTGIAFTYTACKKSSSKPTQTVSAKQISSQVAVNIAATLIGTYGGFNINEGLNAPTALGLLPKGRLRLNSANDELCGTTQDEPYDYSDSENGVSTKINGDVKATYQCTNGVLSGFTLVDGLTVSETSSSLNLAVKLNENITILALNPASETSKFTINGTIGYGGTYNYTSGANKGTATVSFDYTYKAITVDPTQTYPIVSGSATFDTKGSGTTGSWDYSGTVTFLGNNKVKVTISGADYTVDMTTGVVS